MEAACRCKKSITESSEQIKYFNQYESFINQNSHIYNDPTHYPHVDPYYNTNNTNFTNNNIILATDGDVPGKGKKYILHSCYGDDVSKECVEVRSILDNGSSTSLCTTKFVEKFNITTRKSAIPIGFWGYNNLGDSSIRSIALFKTYVTNGDSVCNLVIPAYVIDSLPMDVDVLLGTDQIGSQIGMDTPLHGMSATISLIDRANREVKFSLSNDVDGRSVSNRDSHSSCMCSLDSGLKQTSTMLMDDSSMQAVMCVEELGVDTSASMVVECDCQKTTSHYFRNQLTDLGIVDDQVRRESTSNDDILLNSETQRKPDVRGPPLFDITGLKDSLLPIVSEMNTIRAAISKLRVNVSQLQYQLCNEEKKTVKSRKSKYLSKKKDNLTANLIKEIRECDKEINNLGNELSKVETHARRLAKSIDRSQRRQENKSFRRKMKLIPRTTATINKKASQFRSLFNMKDKSGTINKESTQCNEYIDNVNYIDLLEYVIDSQTSKFRRERRKMTNVEYDVQSERIFILLSSLDNSLDDITLNQFENEIISFVRVNAQKQDDREKLTSTIEWKDLDIKDQQKYVAHPLGLNQASMLTELVSQFEDVLVPKNELIPMGQANVDEEFDVELFEGARERLANKKPKPYPIKHPDMKKLLRKTLKEMDANGVGEWSRLRTLSVDPEFATPTFFTKQKEKWRMVHDFKDLNAETVPLIHPMPRVDTILESIQGKKYFSILDLKSGYHQIRLSDRARKLCAVISPEGVFSMKVLSLGLRNGPMFFQRMMERVLNDSLGVYALVFVDDIVVFSNSFEEHIAHLNSVLNSLRKANLKTNIEKCHFCLKEARLLGKIITADGIKTDPDLIRDMVNFPKPNNSKKVVQFIALCNYYREHVQDFGPKTEPLAKLARKEFIWTAKTWEENPQAEVCFNELKRMMISAPILSYPDFTKSFLIQTDASKYGAGAVLYQYDSNNRRTVVAYASWLFNSAQSKYNTTERELLAIVLATRKWRSYLRGTSFIAETDHEPLKGYMNLHDPYGKIARWVAELCQFDFKIEYIKGISNVPPDTLSRTSDEFTSYCHYILNLNTEEATKFISVRPCKILAKSFDSIAMEIMCMSEAESINLFNSLVGPITNEDWLREIKIDRDYAPMYNYLKNNVLPPDIIEASGKIVDEEALRIMRESSRYFISKKDDLLYFSLVSDKIVRCVPRTYRRLILEECHDSLWRGAHLGRDKTLAKIQENYVFKNMTEYVDVWVSSCPLCQANKRKYDSHGMLNLGVIEASYPLDLMCIDLWSPGKKLISTQGNTTVLTVIDGFSKFAYAIPLRDGKETTVAKALYTQVFNHGVPRRLHSDNGSEFIGEVIAQICKTYNISNSFTTTYHPQGNAYAERIHQFFRNAITSFVNRDQRNWDLMLPTLMNVYNDSVHDALGRYTPSEVYMGRRVNQPPYVNPFDEEPISRSNYAELLNIALDRVQKKIMDESIKKMRRNLNNITNKVVTYNIGDSVGMTIESLPSDFVSAKLFPRWRGPYVITKAARDKKSYYLRDKFDKDLDRPVSILRLKPWYDRKDATDVLGDIPVPRQTFDPMSDESHHSSVEEDLDEGSGDDYIDNDIIVNPSVSQTGSADAKKRPVRQKFGGRRFIDPTAQAALEAKIQYFALFWNGV